MCLLTLFWVIFFCSCCQGQIIPCRHNDDDCILQSSRAAFNAIVVGDPSLGVPPSDPIYIDEIDGTLSTLHFNYTNSIVTGYKNCNIRSIKLKLDELSLSLNISCPHLTITGDYIMNGQLILFPVQGNGEYKIIAIQGNGKYKIFTNAYEMGINATLKKSIDDNGIEHISIKNFNIFYLEPIEPITFDFTNLFNGQKDLADVVVKFANENWKEVAHEFQLSIFTATIRNIIKNINKYLKLMPLEKVTLKSN